MLTLTGTLQALGDLQPEDIPTGPVPRALLTLDDGRALVISGLSQDECRSLAPAFMDAVSLTIGSPS